VDRPTANTDVKERAGVMRAIGRSTPTAWRLPDRPMRMSLALGRHPTARSWKPQPSGLRKTSRDRRERQM